MLTTPPRSPAYASADEDAPVFAQLPSGTTYSEPLPSAPSASKFATPILAGRHRPKRDSRHMRVSWKVGEEYDVESDEEEGDGAKAAQPAEPEEPEETTPPASVRVDLEPDRAFLSTDDLAAELAALGLKLQAPETRPLDAGGKGLPIMWVPPDTHGLDNADELPGTPSRLRRSRVAPTESRHTAASALRF